MESCVDCVVDRLLSTNTDLMVMRFPFCYIFMLLVAVGQSNSSYLFSEICICVIEMYSEAIKFEKKNYHY